MSFLRIYLRGNYLLNFRGELIKNKLIVKLYNDSLFVSWFIKAANAFEVVNNENSHSIIFQL